MSVKCKHSCGTTSGISSGPSDALVGAGVEEQSHKECGCSYPEQCFQGTCTCSTHSCLSGSVLGRDCVWFLPFLTASLLLSSKPMHPHGSQEAESPLLSRVAIIFLLVTMKSFLWLDFNLSRLIFSFAVILLVCGNVCFPSFEFILKLLFLFAFFFPLQNPSLSSDICQD